MNREALANEEERKDKMNREALANELVKLAGKLAGADGQKREASEDRWEFVVNLTGWGNTKEEAWQSVIDGIKQDGLSSAGAKAHRFKE